MSEKLKLMDKVQVENMRHAVNSGNRFYDDFDNASWNDLVDKGYATKRPGWDTDSAYYIPTTEGIKVLQEADSNA
ncbi:hypothetical protein NCCP2222_02110 [Sporosarcina sp. NCCP-2222]|uniref:hypothetical protein n=1 Tax=Sporosarcina sp. NCCP-2222 TaxID=2935073 RepID=UPI0020840CD1|nr:hypothetical protein [Sporosarcina sp. NCCP-2222]GKV54264.1 hypothetical protein NCCP2222_02110 [Sporosarcina sp. NCCP-2222]